MVELYSHRSEDVPSACSTSYNLLTHTERIPTLLSASKGHDEEKSIFIMNEMLEGYNSIVKEYGCAFDITPEMVGFNKNQDVRVWFNSNFSKCEPETELLGTKYSKTDHEHRLINKIFEIAEASNEGGSFSPAFKNSKSLNLSKPYRFTSSIDFLRNYAAESSPDMF